MRTVRLAWHFVASMCRHGQARVGSGRSAGTAHEEGSLLDAATGLTVPQPLLKQTTKRDGKKTRCKAISEQH